MAKMKFIKQESKVVKTLNPKRLLIVAILVSNLIQIGLLIALLN